MAKKQVAGEPQRPKPTRVWIELDYPNAKSLGVNSITVEERDALGDKRAELASQMLERLGCRPKVFWWHPTKGRYCVTVDQGGGFLECSDNGHWFSLEFLAGPKTVKVEGPVESPKPMNPQSVVYPEGP